MFWYFKGNFTWSLAVNLAIAAGGDLGQIDLFLGPLRDKPADPASWTSGWVELGKHQETLAQQDISMGYSLSASARLFRASLYYLTGERQIAPGDDKSNIYRSGLATFIKAIEHMPQPLQRVEIPSPDGILPGYIIPAHTSPKKDRSSPPPLVVFYNGFDVTKEILYCLIRNTLADRGISCLVIDGPGTGEPLRLRSIPSRHDYEVPTAAIVDYLVTRPEIADPDRLGLMGISLGGYYAPRGAAFEPRIKAVVAWGAIYDYGLTWRQWRLVQPTASSVPSFQLPWVMGTMHESSDITSAAWEEAMKRAADRVGAFRLQDALPFLKQPFLVVHGEKDELIPLSDAQAVFDAAASEDKELRVFTEAEGGSEHVQIDDMDPCRQYIADWFLHKL